MVRYPVRVVRVVVAALCAIGAAACGVAADTAPVPPPPPPVVSSTTPPPDPAAVGADELGQVPILMYHQLSARPAGEYDQTPAEFRAELDRLYREGYRPITAAQYIAGAIDIPAGTHPVVLTFDDSTTSQLRFGPDGRPVRDCAVAILEDFAAAHPDFPARATFYVTNDAFGGDPRALPYLAANGYEIGSHTASHANLAAADPAGIRHELASNVAAIRAAAPGTTVTTLALPLGMAPDDPAPTRAGSAGGTSYRFDAVMLVGANPAPSPFGAVDPGAVPRIRSGAGVVPFDSAYWLDRLAADPGARYTSDGDPDRISFPRDSGAGPVGGWAGRARPY